MDPFMPPYQVVRTRPETTATAKQLVVALIGLGLRGITLIEDRDKVLVSVCHGLVAAVKDDGIWWHSPRELRPGVPLYVHRGTVAGAAEALAGDHALLNPGPQPPAEVRHVAAPL
ncbi:hypothetical protein [Spongiactinospora gelatinilytica]|nr:hypothetical protein [Spongiactinospora gelatinilytica]